MSSDDLTYQPYQSPRTDPDSLIHHLRWLADDIDAYWREGGSLFTGDQLAAVVTAAEFIERWALRCGDCNAWLTEPGGIRLSPPTADGTVTKTHLCATCTEGTP